MIKDNIMLNNKLYKFIVANFHNICIIINTIKK